MEAKHIRPIDPDVKTALRLVEHLTPKEIAKRSGGIVGASTIYKWRSGAVRSPLNYTLNGVLKAAGYMRQIVPIEQARTVRRHAASELVQ
jgi:hypothetical protein